MCMYSLDSFFIDSNLKNLQFDNKKPTAMAPVPFKAWVVDILALKDSSICTQRDSDRGNVDFEGSEDCLYMNIYTPEKTKSKQPLPVMVWLHGGGWGTGSGISSYYGPDFLLDHDVILVSPNYRLGPLGFLSTETLDCPGNFGFKDQLEVLKWIQQNIAAFGGNPENVTIFGESAGGATVTYLMLSEMSRGLFHKAISQSGTSLNPWAQPEPKGIPAAKARKLAEILGCGNSTNDYQLMLNCLRKISDRDIMDSTKEFFAWRNDPMIPFRPVVEPEHEGAFLAVFPTQQGISHGDSIPLMIGMNADEGLLRSVAILNQAELLDDFKTNFESVLPIMLYYNHHTTEVKNEITQKLLDFYLKEGLNFNKTNYENITQIMTDALFLNGIDDYIRNRVINKGNAPTFVYFFDHKGDASFSEFYKGGEDYYGKFDYLARYL